MIVTMKMLNVVTLFFLIIITTVTSAYQMSHNNNNNNNKNNCIKTIKEFKQTYSNNTNTNTNTSTNNVLPKHIGFILDGNARWAHRHNLPMQIGHVQGAHRAISILRLCKSLSIEYVTMYVLSAENMKRQKKELSDIIQIVLKNVTMFRDEAEREGICVKILGDLNYDDGNAVLPLHVREELCALQRDSAVWSSSESSSESNHTKTKKKTTTICLAINYGARQDIVNACRNLALESMRDGIPIDEESLQRHLTTKDIPDPDFIVRKSNIKYGLFIYVYVCTKLSN